MNDSSFPTQNFGAPLAGSALPWIDKELKITVRAVKSGRAKLKPTRFLGYAPGTLPIDGNCVRISSMRCHSQALTIKLKQNMSIADIEKEIASRTSGFV